MNERELKLYASIDCSHFLLSKVLERLQRKESPIEKMIWDVTWYNKDQFEKDKHLWVELVQAIMEAKKELWIYDWTEEILLDKIKNLWK